MQDSAHKTDARVEAYGTVDELNSAIGVLLANFDIDDDARAALTIIQNELFDLGADLSTPVVPNPKWEPLRIIQPSIDRLEGWCDEFIEGLGKLDSFILPGGSPASSQFHLLRTMARRAERQGWAAAKQYGLEDGSTEAEGGISPLPLKYLNRLQPGPQGQVARPAAAIENYTSDISSYREFQQLPNFR